MIVSTKLDIATDVVVRLLEERGLRVTRLNTEDFPFDSLLTTTLDRDHLSVDFHAHTLRVNLDGLSSVWYRRFRSPERPDAMLPGVYDFCLRESRSALLGSILVQRARIMSHPARIWTAEHKIFQLSAATAAGLLIPETIVTNDPSKIVEGFHRFGGKMIAKPVRTGFVDYGSEQYAIFTSQVPDSHLERVEDARWSPSIYQPLIPKRCDIRVTVVGTHLFAAEIDSQSDPDATVDWRHTSNPALPHRKITLPSIVESGIRQLVLSLGLAFGAVDLIQAPDGQYIFLEINPNGQWLWLDDVLDLGISASVADWLAGDSVQGQ